MPDSVKIHISLVSYLNSYPFHFGLLNSEHRDLSSPEIVPPALCAENFKTGKSNIALIPVGALPAIDSYKIIEPFCIAACGEVKSVFLQSSKPVAEIKTIATDPASRSSNLLTKVLCKHAWNINPAFITNEHEADARVIIGDRALHNTNAFPFQFDLAEEWKNKYNLPFVFAVWIAQKDIPAQIISELNMALEFGVSNIEKAVNKLGTADLDKDEAIEYLNENIVYRMDSDAKEAMELFLRLAREIA